MANISGTWQDDFLVGTSSSDYIDGGPYSGLGEDVLIGGGGNDTIYGGLEADVLIGGTGNDTFVIKGVDGWDSFDGGTGSDTISIQDVSTYAYYSLVKIDSMTGIEKIVNTHYKDAVIEVRSDTDFRGVQLVNIDEIRGSAGGETIWGSNGADVIDAREGDDVLDGGTGNDVLTGGLGSDTFYFASADGRDTVTDFTDGVDLLQLETSATDIADLSISQVGSDVEIVADSTTIILNNFTATDLTNADFDFI